MATVWFILGRLRTAVLALAVMVVLFPADHPVEPQGRTHVTVVLGAACGAAGERRAEGSGADCLNRGAGSGRG